MPSRGLNVLLGPKEVGIGPDLEEVGIGHKSLVVEIHLVQKTFDLPVDTNDLLEQF